MREPIEGWFLTQSPPRLTAYPDGPPAVGGMPRGRVGRRPPQREEPPRGRGGAQVGPRTSPLASGLV